MPALQSTVTALPLTYLPGRHRTLGGAATGTYDQFAVTNIGKTAARIRSQRSPTTRRRRCSFPLLRAMIRYLDLALTIEPDRPRTAYAYWTANRLGVGQYQGQILIPDP